MAKNLGVSRHTVMNHAKKLSLPKKDQKAGDGTKVFLLGKGVESENIKDAKFNVPEQMKTFVAAGGKIFSCGSCLKIRNSGGSEICPISTMKDLHEIIKESEKVICL